MKRRKNRTNGGDEDVESEKGREDHSVHSGDDGSSSTSFSVESQVSDTSDANVDFEFFDPSPENDYHAIRDLLNQLFERDSSRLDVKGLTDLILCQPLVGTVVKTDGLQGDMWAFMSVLNVQEHKNVPAVSGIVSYILEKSLSDKVMHQQLKGLLAPGSTASVGLILHERIINVPQDIAPPMYRMLLEEIDWAVEDNEPFDFQYFISISKVFLEISSGKCKKSKKQKTDVAPEIVMFAHPEDHALTTHAQSSCYYNFNDQPTRESQSEFTYRSKGCLSLFTKQQLVEALKSFGTLTNDV